MRLISKTFKTVNDYGINVTPEKVLDSKKCLSLTNLIEFLLESSLIKDRNELNELVSNIWDEWRSCLPSRA